MNNNIIEFNNTELGNITGMMIQDEPMFNLDDISFSLGYITKAKGKEYLHKQRIEKVITNGLISTVVQGGK